MHVGQLTPFEAERMRLSIAAIRADVAEREAAAEEILEQPAQAGSPLMVAIVAALLIGAYAYSQRRKTT